MSKFIDLNLLQYFLGKIKENFAKKDHTHLKENITDFPESIKNPAALSIQFNGSENANYNGEEAKTVNITPSAIGAATTSQFNLLNTLVGNKANKGKKTSITISTKDWQTEGEVRTINYSVQSTTNNDIVIVAPDPTQSITAYKKYGEYGLYAIQEESGGIYFKNLKNQKPDEDIKVNAATLF